MPIKEFNEENVMVSLKINMKDKLNIDKARFNGRDES